MSVFTDEEIEYLKSQLLGRLATVGSDGQPHVVAVSFRYNAVLDTIDIGGHDFARHKKYRDVQRNPRVALIVDDLQSVNPWRPQGIEVRGEAEVLKRGGRGARPRLRSGDVPHPSAADRELGDHVPHDPRRSLYLVAAAPRVSSALSARSCSPYPHQ